MGIFSRLFASVGQTCFPRLQRGNGGFGLIPLVQENASLERTALVEHTGVVRHLPPPPIAMRTNVKNERCIYPNHRRMLPPPLQMLDEFDALPTEDRAEVVAELLRRTALAPHDLPDDHDLVVAADRLFTELDSQEQA